MKETLMHNDYRNIGLDEPSECDMYAMFIKDFITEAPDNSVVKSHTRDGTPMFKVTKWLGGDAVYVTVSRASQPNGGFHFCLEVSVCKGKEESVCVLSSWDFLPELNPIPELYDILREKFVRACYKHLTDVLNRHKPPTEEV